MKTLVIEDDYTLADILTYNLKKEGYEVSVAHDGQDGLRKAQMTGPDVVVLDVMLPVIDGLEVCRQLRASALTRSMIIIMLTAKAEESDELIGLSIGADDYVTKPFSVKVLLERIKSHLRRRSSASETANDVVTVGGISVDRRAHQAMVDGRTVPLTYTEFRLLDSLIRQPGRAFTRSELINNALGDGVVVLERTIDVHVRGLRQKLGDRADRVATVRGVGYRFLPAGEEAPVSEGVV